MQTYDVLEQQAVVVGIINVCVETYQLLCVTCPLHDLAPVVGIQRFLHASVHFISCNLAGTKQLPTYCQQQSRQQTDLIGFVEDNLLHVVSRFSVPVFVAVNDKVSIVLFYFFHHDLCVFCSLVICCV